MKILTRLSGLIAVALVLAGTAQAAIYTETYDSGFANGGVIPDGNTTGWRDTRNVTDIPSGWTIADVTVTFAISGGYNGDLYGYLSHGGVLIPLLQRVGTSLTDKVGYGDNGFNAVTLADGGAKGNIHDYGGGFVPTETYAPDSSGATFANKFDGLTANGNWTLFFADLSGGDLTPSTLGSWSLDIIAVPEPVNVALGLFAGVLLLVILARSRPVWNRVHRWRAGIARWIDAV